MAASVRTIARGNAVDAKHGRGDRIGRYVVVDTIGGGAMGTVYAAYDPELARTVALKVVRPQAALRVGAHAMRVRLLREAQAMARVVHPNVVPVFDVGQHGDRLYLAMERVEGANLRRWLARARPSLRAVLDVLVPAGRGLAAAHRVGLVHRDFKPENVLVAGDARGAPTRVCVTDFGLARPNPAREDGDAAMAGVLGLTLTHEDDRLGTPAYMAPEQQRGEADHRSDVYAYCVVLHEALHGRRPEERPSAAPRSVPAWLRRIIARGLAADPERRFESMDALLEEIERHRQRERRMLRVGLGTAAGILAIAFAASTWERGEQSPELLDARTQCLHAEWTRLRTIAVLAESEDPEALLDELQPPSRCRTIDAATGPDPSAWAAARETMAIEALVLLARVEHDRGKVDGATRAVDEALRLARAARRPRLEAEAWLVLAEIEGAHPEERRFCTRMALAALDAAGGDPWLQAGAARR